MCEIIYNGSITLANSKENDCFQRCCLVFSKKLDFGHAFNHCHMLTDIVIIGLPCLTLVFFLKHFILCVLYALSGFSL